MGEKSAIQWTNATWNPVTGCTKVSQGCKHCYAETLANRLWARQYPPNPDGSPRRFTDIRLHENRLELPLRWREPRMIFVNSVSDLFHEAVPDEFILKVFSVMERANQHTFQVLTKRPQRMVDVLGGTSGAGLSAPPLPNVWLGVSVEDQKAADERIPLLLQVPAAVRFLSCEPLLGPLDLTRHLECESCLHRAVHWCGDPVIDWVIVGGESGHDARPFELNWASSILRQCREAGVPCFMKQLGRRPWSEAGPVALHDSHGGDMAEWPAGLRVREYPKPVTA